MAMEEAAVTALVFDASKAGAGAREFAQAGANVIDTNRKVEQSQDAIVTSTERVVAAQGNQTKALERLYRQIDPAHAAQQKFAQGQAVLDRAHQKGAISSDEHAKRLDQLRQRYGQVTIASQQTAASMSAGIKATRDAMAAQEAASVSTRRLNGFVQQSGYQISDAANQIATGTNAWTVFGMQAGQLLGTLGPMGAALGAVVNVGGVAAGIMSKNAEQTALFTDTLEIFEGRALESGNSLETLTDKYRALSTEMQRLLRITLESDIAKQSEKLAKDFKSAWDTIRITATGGAQDVPAVLTALQQLGKDKDLLGFIEKLQDLNRAGTLKLLQDSDVRALLEGNEQFRVLQARLADLNGTATDAQRALIGVADAQREAAKTAYDLALASGQAAAGLFWKEDDLDKKIAALKGGEKAMKGYAEEQVRATAYKKAYDDAIKADMPILYAEETATRVATKAVEAHRLELKRTEDQKSTNAASRKAESQAERDAKAYKNVSDELTRGIEEQKRLAGVVGQSVEAQREANAETKIAEALSKAHTTASTAEGKAIADKVREQEKWRNVVKDSTVLDGAKKTLEYSEKELSLMGQAEPLRERALKSYKIQTEAAELAKTTTAENAAEWVRLQERIADTEAIKAYQQEVQNVSRDIARDWTETMFDALILKDKNASILDAFRALGKRIALALLETNIVLPITTAIVGSVPGLFGIQGPAAGGAAQSGMGGVGNLLSVASGVNSLSGGGLMGALFPGGGFSLNSALNAGGAALGLGGASIAAQGAAASTIAEVAAADVMAAWGAGGSGIAAGSGAGAGAASTLATGAGDAAMAAGGGLTSGGATLASILGPAAAGFGIGMLPGMFGANKTVSAGIGALGGAGAGFLIGGPVGALIGGGAGLLGGLFGGQTKPSNMEGNVSIDFASGKATVGGQTGDKFSQQNRDAASSLGGQVQQLAATLEALLPGQQIKGSGLVAVGNRDGLRAEYGGQTAEFGKENTAGLVQWFTKQFAEDLKDGFEKGDLTEQVAGNLKKVLDKGITGSVEQFVAAMTLASTDFTKVFDALGKAQPDQAALEVQTAAQSFVTMRDAAQKLGLTVDGLAESFKAGTDRMLDAQIRAAQGLTGTSSAQVIRASFTTNATALLSAGQDPSKAVALYGAQMSALVNSFGWGVDALKQLADMAKQLDAADPVAALYARTRAEQVRTVVAEDLAMRETQAKVQLGKVTQEAYDMAALELQQKREIAGITDEATLALIRQTQATEKLGLAAQQTEKAAKAAAENQKAFASAATSTRSYLLSLMTGEAGGLSAQDRYRNARGEYASASAAIGPQATAEQLARQTEAAKALLDASRAVNGSTTEYFRDLTNVTGDLAKSAQLTPDDPVVTAINALKSSIDGLGGKIDVQVSVDAINFIRGEIEQTITTHVSYSGLTQREIQLANGILDAVNQSVKVALSPATGMTARELQVYQGALSNLDQSITAIVDTSGLTGANREIALGQLSDATRTINAALGQFPSLSAVEREFVLGTSRDFARVFNAFTGAAPNLTAVQQGILLGISDSFTKTYQQAVGVMPSMNADQQAILMGVSDSFTRTFQAAASAAPTLTADQLAILRGKSEEFTKLFVAATNDLVLTDDEKAILSAKDANIRQTVDQFVNRDVTETVSTTVMRDMTSGFQAIQLQTTSMMIRQLEEIGRLILAGSVNTVRAITGNGSWGKEELDAVLGKAKPTVLSTGEANYLAMYADIADWWTQNPTASPLWHYQKFGAPAGLKWDRGYADGGIVSNGVRGVDSVVARLADGTPIGLAGGEYVTPTDGVTGETKPMLDYIRQNHRLPSASPMRPVVMPAANANRASSNGEMVSELRALREEVAALRRENSTMIQKQALMDDAGRDKQTAALTTALSSAKPRYAVGAA